MSQDPAGRDVSAAGQLPGRVDGQDLMRDLAATVVVADAEAYALGERRLTGPPRALVCRRA